MLGIYSSAFMTATRHKSGDRTRWDAPVHRVRDDLPLRTFTGRRS